MTQDLSRAAASAAVEAIGWRYLLGELVATVTVSSLDEAVGAAAVATAACGVDADTHLQVDVRADRIELFLQSGLTVTDRDVELAHGITDALRDLGLDTSPTGPGRSVQLLELAIDALDIPVIRPFWKAVLDYADEHADATPTDALVDPARRGPALWFQQLDEPRPQRNRIHFDITVPHDEADRRIAAALAAGGTLVSDERARAFWILADAEGNEICVCTWQDRD
jgi:4a-hydroxytetrahydrobiopterin dehydratase